MNEEGHPLGECEMTLSGKEFETHERTSTGRAHMDGSICAACFVPHIKRQGSEARRKTWAAAWLLAGIVGGVRYSV